MCHTSFFNSAFWLNCDVKLITMRLNKVAARLTILASQICSNAQRPDERPQHSKPRGQLLLRKNSIFNENTLFSAFPTCQAARITDDLSLICRQGSKPPHTPPKHLAWTTETNETREILSCNNEESIDVSPRCTAPWGCIHNHK